MPSAVVEVAAHELGNFVLMTRVATEDFMIAQIPQIASLADKDSIGPGWVEGIVGL